jgi:methylase of polypeptide subunit release factors
MNATDTGLRGAADDAWIHWHEDGQEKTARWGGLNMARPPRRVQVVDDRLGADEAFRLASEGTGLLWRGDFHNARQLLQALARRAEPKPARPCRGAPAGGPTHETPREAPREDPLAFFHRHRMQQAQRARILGMVLVEFDAQGAIGLRRAPDVAAACREAHGEIREGFVAPLRELLGMVGAHEWRKNGVEIAALGARIHPHYGVFSPVRGEYVDLVARAPLPAPCDRALDLGTGTGVLAALLARRGVGHVVATDSSPRALACARDNIARLQLDRAVTVVEADLYPPGPAGEPAFDLIVCNPPWLPGKPGSMLEHAVYDPDSRLLRGFLAGAAARLRPTGQAWLVLSDLAELLGLRGRDQLARWIADAGLVVVGHDTTRPVHGRAQDRSDPLHEARRREVTSLWRLGLPPAGRAT